MALATPETIRTLQRKLYCKAKQEPGFRFYALYDKVFRADILGHAYALVRRNKGAPGFDGVTFEAIEGGEGVEAFLAELREDLRAKTYRAAPVRRVSIPKPDGGERPLGIPIIRDRVAQAAVKLVIEPIFEADFREMSYGFRPKRSAHDASDAVAEALRGGHADVIDADVSKYFDTIPHAKLLAVVAERIADGPMLGLIQQWLKAPVVEELAGGRGRWGGGKGSRRGTPQGGVISPLLANLYLHLLDRIWERWRLAERCGARLVRYADDLVVLCAGDVEPALALLRRVLRRLGLSLNEAKTRVVDAREESFDFLGFTFGLRRSRKSGKVYPHVEPSKRAVCRINKRLGVLSHRRLTPLPLEVVVEQMNQALRGWGGYFHHRNCSKVFGRVRWHAEERLRTHLRKRHKVRRRKSGYRRFPTRQLYDRYGLYKLPVTAGWTTAHALR